jgi:4'-phosphopantetheinyl transferase
MRPTDVLWNTPPSGLNSVGGDVHVFCASLDVPPNRLEELVQPLSDNEWQRADRLHSQRDRQRFLAGRGTLREILGVLLNVKPASFLFSIGEFGKPRIAAPVAADLLHFNMAHSDSIAIYATAKHALGVDVERIRAMDEAEQIASRFFSPREAACLLALPAEQRMEAFFNCWTRKEAYLKAIGLGLDDRLGQIEVSLAPSEAAELLGVPDDSQQWELHTLIPASQFVGALAIQPEDSPVHCWKWTGPP